jgi:GAF domain-containing protein
MKGAMIRLLDKESNTLKVVASHGLSEEFLSYGNTVQNRLASRALNGETVCISDVSTSDMIMYKEAFKNEGIISLIGTPIVSKDEVIGVLRLLSDTQREFDGEFIDMVKAIGHQGGLAIQNASMYLQLQESKKDLEQEIWSHRSWF